MKKEETKKENRIKEYSFSSKRKMMSIIREKNGNFISYVKGAPDVIIKNSTKELINGKEIKLTEKRKKELIEIYEDMASNALRVLGFAFKSISKKFDQAVFFQKLEKTGRGKYLTTFELLCENPAEKSEKEILKMYIEKMEGIIREKPEFYLWSHKRWKRKRPEGIPLQN